MWSVPLQPPTRQQVLAYHDKLGPQHAIRLGVIGNRSSRKNMASRFSLLGRLVPEAELIWQTETSTHLVQAITELLFAARINVLAIAGGDGTVHHVVNLLIRLQSKIRETTGQELQLPPLLVIPGGTMNVFARAFGTKEVPIRAMRRFCSQFAGRPLGRLQTRNVPMLDIRSENHGRIVGFVLGSSLVVEALKTYDDLGAGYHGLARFLVHATTGTFFNTAVWKKYGHRLNATCGELAIDNTAYGEAQTFVASTIPLTLAKGRIVAMASPDPSDKGFASVVVSRMRERELVRVIPHLLFGGKHPYVSRPAPNQKASFRGSFTVDGEIFESRTKEPDTVTVTRLPVEIPVVIPE